MIQTCPDSFLTFAQEIADAARPIARRYFRAGVDVTDKLDNSPVTQADREIEHLLRTRIEDAYPHHGIVGEEEGIARESAEFIWVIDPIDGTRAFITGRPTFGTLIALLQGGEPILGVIEMPALEERWVGAHGHATRLNGAVAQARACEDLEAAQLFASSPNMFDGDDKEAFERVRRRAKYDHYGADCLHYGLLASGHLDLVVEADLKPFDYCAVVAVVRGAGGYITDWEGEPLGLRSDGRVVAAGDRRVHEAALELLA